ncbi:hypothetical protein ASZ90_018582 [hydrocarbon metagenome]|uniref:Uncharacterized protein n=1 Tax=hydrocarbon metagenome TaxID=938273 RepID=A0A0W8E5Y3_9ZZZZ
MPAASRYWTATVLLPSPASRSQGILVLKFCVLVTVVVVAPEAFVPFATRYPVTPTLSVADRFSVTLVELDKAAPLLMLIEPVGAVGSVYDGFI